MAFLFNLVYMKFTSLQNNGHGSQHAPVTLDTVKRYSDLVFENLHSFTSWKEKQGDKTILHANWKHFVMFHGVEVYNFNSSVHCYIEEEEIKANEEQCSDIIDKTHEDLRTEWEKHRVAEVNFFPSLLPLSTEEKPLFVAHLMKTLNGE